LLRYRLAQAAAADIRAAFAPESEKTVPLERFLREQMRESTNPYTRRRYRQVPLYLQDVLLTVSRTTSGGYTNDPDNCNALINRALELDDVLFLTLNYDTLLDDRPLRVREVQLPSFSDSRWALVKLHGSAR
jgi:hypothetical protein